MSDTHRYHEYSVVPPTLDSHLLSLVFGLHPEGGKAPASTMDMCAFYVWELCGKCTGNPTNK